MFKSKVEAHCRDYAPFAYDPAFMERVSSVKIDVEMDSETSRPVGVKPKE